MGARSDVVGRRRVEERRIEVVIMLEQDRLKRMSGSRQEVVRVNLGNAL